MVYYDSLLSISHDTNTPKIDFSYFNLFCFFTFSGGEKGRKIPLQLFSGLENMTCPEAERKIRTHPLVQASQVQLLISAPSKPWWLRDEGWSWSSSLLLHQLTSYTLAFQADTCPCSRSGDEQSEARVHALCWVSGSASTQVSYCMDLTHHHCLCPE